MNSRATILLAACMLLSACHMPYSEAMEQAKICERHGMRPSVRNDPFETYVSCLDGDGEYWEIDQL